MPLHYYKHNVKDKESVYNGNYVVSFSLNFNYLYTHLLQSCHIQKSTAVGKTQKYS